MASRPFSDPQCPLCSKPVRSGSLVLFERDELIHVHCRSRAYHLMAMDGVEQAQVVRHRAAEVLRRVSGAPHVAAPRLKAACPLCGHPAVVTDWRPVSPWLVVEDCPCGAFFIWADLTQSRLTRLTPAARRDLAARVRRVRRAGQEAWCTSRDGTVSGPLVVRTTRPDRPT
jgi:hypothetical protein